MNQRFHLLFIIIEEIGFDSRYELAPQKYFQPFGTDGTGTLLLFLFGRSKSNQTDIIAIELFAKHQAEVSVAEYKLDTVYILQYLSQMIHGYSLQVLHVTIGFVRPEYLIHIR